MIKSDRIWIAGGGVGGRDEDGWMDGWMKRKEIRSRMERKEVVLLMAG